MLSDFSSVSWALLNSSKMKMNHFFAKCLVLFGVFSLWNDQACAAGADAERLSLLLEEALALFQHAEYAESYEKYQEVLELDPDHQDAIEQTFELAAIFKRSGELWKQQGEIEEAQKNTRFYQQIVRELLKLLTGRWQTVLNAYSSRTEAEKQQEERETIQQLQTLIQIVTNIHYLYEHFYQNDNETKTLLDKLQRALEMYQKELDLYE